MMTKTSLPLFFGSLLALAACGDDEGSGGAGGGTTATGTGTTGPTSSTTSTKSSSSSTSTATSSSSTGGGGGQQFMVPDPFAVPVSAAGPDQLQSVTAGPNDTFLAAGFVADAVGGPRAVYVVKYSATGSDNSFGTMGVKVLPLTFVGGSDEIDITTQSDGKILISATVPNATTPTDRDVAVIRLLDDGSVDINFGTDGIATLNLNDAHDNGMMLVGMDGSRSITVDGDDNIFVHANSRALGTLMGEPRTDTDFTVVKLTPDGAVDATFGEGGQFRLDIAQVNATPRAIKALSDGSLLAGGYANTPDAGDTVQPVLYKLTADGDLDLSFATGGLFHEPVLTIQTEVYNFALHGNNFVTAGYGRDTGDTNDYVSMRFDVDTGVRDLTWGGAPNGAVVIDPSGMMLGSNARSALGLPNGGTVIIGSTGPSNVPEQDAVFVVLDENGALDTSYLTGIHLFQLGSNGNDQFWGGAVSGNNVSIVGYKGGGMTQTDMNNDDSYGIVFEMMP